MAKRRGDDGLEQVAAYHKELQLCLREHESKFDNAVLLAAGGAFTISAAFISDLSTPLRAGTWLAVSWFAWGLCLLAGVGGHLIGAHATKRVLDLLDSQVYDFDALMSGTAAKLIKPLNVTTFVLLIVGFIAFGRFTFANLDFGGQREEEQQSLKEEGGEKEDGPRAIRALAPVAKPAVAAPQTNEPQVRSDDGRQEDAAAATPAATAAAADSEERSGPVDAREANSSHGAEPASGLAPTN